MLLATAGQKLSRKKPHDNPHVAEPIAAISWPTKNCRCVDIGKLRPAMLEFQETRAALPQPVLRKDRC